jgi:hypothetical protein
MASSQSVPDEAAWRYFRIFSAGCGVFVSQSWKWLTERFSSLPQVRLVFGCGLPQLAAANENFVDW